MNKQQSPKSMTYEHILFELLSIPKTFLSSQNKEDAIRKRLLKAHELMSSGMPDAIAIAACLHVASSVVLLESTPKKVDDTLENIQKDRRFNEVEPTTILASAALYFLLQKNQENLNQIKGQKDKLLKKEGATGNAKKELSKEVEELKKEQNALLDLSHQLEKVNWMVGSAAAKALGMK